MNSLKQVEPRLRLEEVRNYYSTDVVNSPATAIQIVKDILKELDREHLCVVNLDTQLRPINYSVVSIGGISETGTRPADLFKTAILSNASGIIIFHNHPSGVLKCSKQDIEVTERIAKGCAVLGIQLFDHIIVGGGRDDYLSIRTEHQHIFETDY